MAILATILSLAVWFGIFTMATTVDPDTGEYVDRL